jgi:ribosomal protein S18 acetylase RimI-like enzyme
MASSAIPATSGNIEIVLDLMSEFHEESGYVLDRRLAQSALEELLGNFALGRIWILERNHTVAGYVVLTVGFSMEYGGKAAFLDDLFVRPEHRRHGLARLGIETLLEECRMRGIRAVHVEAGHENEAANALYSELGFRPTGRRLLTRRLSRQATAFRE